MKKFFLIFTFCFAAGCARVPKELPVVDSAAENVSVDGSRTAVKAGRKDPLLKADYVLRILGEPTVKRRETPSEVWVYAQSGCVLFIYMNEQDDGSALVRHMEIGTPTFRATRKDSLSCLKTAAKLR